MFPTFQTGVTWHYFGDDLLVTKDDRTFYFKRIEKEILKKVNGIQSMNEIVDQTAKALNTMEFDRVRQVLVHFLESQARRNIIQLANSPQPCEMRVTGKEGYRFPMHVILEITNRCNLKCTHCYKEAGYGKRDDISSKLLLDKLKYFEGKVADIQITGGEPMTHPQFWDIIEYCKSYYPTSITTAATLITSNNVDKFDGLQTIQVSLYSVNKEEHERVTLVKGSFQRTIEGIRLLTDKGYPITVSSIVTQENYQDLELFVQLCVSLEVYAVKFGTFSRYGRGRELDSSWELSAAQDTQVADMLLALSMKYKDQIQIFEWDDEHDQTFDLNHGGFSCGAGNLSWVISEFGNIKPCVFLPEDRFTTGNIFTEDLDLLCRDNHIRNLYFGVEEWEHALNADGHSTERICPVIKNYLDFFEAGEREM